MSGFALAMRQFKFQNRAFWRNPASAFFTFAFPLMFLVIFNSLLGGGTVETYGRETSTTTFYVPAILAFAVITATYTNIAISVTFARDEGILKRVRGTPMPALWFLLSKILHSVFVCAILVAIVVTAGTLFYNVDPPTEVLPQFILIILVGAASFCALGLAITAVIPNPDAAPPVVNASILPLLFLSGIFIPLDGAPQWMISVAKVFPVYHYAQAILGAFNPFDPEFKGFDLAIVAAWGVLGLILAAKFFSWEPRK
jgi:ABC-2 type transport system permease protein